MRVLETERRVRRINEKRGIVKKTREGKEIEKERRYCMKKREDEREKKRRGRLRLRERK
jgi:hypothetical protein